MNVPIAGNQPTLERRARPRLPATGQWVVTCAFGLLLLGITLPWVARNPAAVAAQTAASGGSVYVVEITGEIDLGLAPYLDRILDEANDDEAAAVIVEINTPGGRLDAALQMRDALLGADVPTVAFVNREAFSAGALIAIACERIYLAPGAVLGAATPVDASGETASEKVVSAVRTTFRSTAEERGRDPLVAEAMVDPDVAIPGLIERGQLLTLSTSDALTWGYADGIVNDRAALLSQLGLADREVIHTSPSLAEEAVRFLTNPIVSSLLIIAALLLIVGDFFVEGFGIVGVLGLGLLGLFFWGQFLAGLAGWEDVALVALGLILIGVEIFVIPGFGVPGILGLIALFAGLFLALLSRDIRTPAMTERAAWIVTWSFLGVLLGIIAILWLLPRGGRHSGLVLQEALGDRSPAAGRPARPPRGWLRLFGGGRELVLPRDRPDPPLPPPPDGTLTGATGVALSDLRPSGFADIAGRRVDVVTSGEYVRQGDRIEIVRDEGYRRVVRKATG